MINRIEGQRVTWYDEEEGEREGPVLKAQAIALQEGPGFVLLILDENSQLQTVNANRCTVIREDDDEGLLEEM